MLDIETLGREPGCVVLSIGAVQFGVDGVGTPFYKEIDTVSCEDAGLTIEAATLDWWLDQDEKAQECLRGGVPLDEALRLFSQFYELFGCEEIWANAPTFDCRILEAAYEATGLEKPWTFREERCFRTLKALPGAVTEPSEEPEGVAHDALYDARWQAAVAVENLREMDGRSGN